MKLTWSLHLHSHKYSTVSTQQDTLESVVKVRINNFEHTGYNMSGQREAAASVSWIM